MFRACVSAVRSAITSTSAIRRLVWPRLISVATSSSRGVSGIGSVMPTAHGRVF